MAKGFILAITTALIFVLIMVYTQNFYSSQSEDLARVSNALAAEKVMHTWSDVIDDLALAAFIVIEKDEETLNINDTLPAPLDVSTLLHLYGRFVEEYYETPDIEIKFLTQTGQLMDLGALPSKITIYPFNIEYYYPSWAKNELYITSPAENLSAIEQIVMHINLTNVRLDCFPANPSSSTPCDFVNPSSECDYKTVHPLYVNISFSDYLGSYFYLPHSCFDIDKHSTENLNVGNSTSNYYVKVLFGALPTVLNVQLQNTVVNTSTSIILNTSDFYINYLSKLYVGAVNYNITKVDWA